MPPPAKSYAAPRCASRPRTQSDGPIGYYPPGVFSREERASGFSHPVDTRRDCTVSGTSGIPVCKASPPRSPSTVRHRSPVYRPHVRSYQSTHWNPMPYSSCLDIMAPPP